MVGRALGIPEHFTQTAIPFPVPVLPFESLVILLVQKLELLRSADVIFIEELRAWKLYQETWQAFAVVLPVQTVGVMWGMSERMRMSLHSGP